MRIEDLEGEKQAKEKMEATIEGFVRVEMPFYCQKESEDFDRRFGWK